MAGDADQWRTWDQGIVEANKGVVAQFRANAGRVPGYCAGAAVLLLHHRGPAPAGRG